MDTYLKRTWAQIDLDALSHNVCAIRRHLHPHTKIMGIVKADGYGHGAVAVALQLQQNGVDMLGVSNLNEAMQLRQAGLSLPILILGYTPPDACDTLLQNDLTQTVYSAEQAQALNAAALALGGRLTVHLKVDTGMSRLGFACDRDWDKLLAVCRLPALHFEGLFTHFSTADDAAFTSTQMARFVAVRQYLLDNGVKFYVTHCANSLAVLKYPYTCFDMVRPGLILYGQLPSRLVDNALALRPVMSLHTVVSQVKRIGAGDGVSYDRRFIADGDRTIAVVPVGYADGYPRLLSGRAHALVNGARVPLLGNVCMDMTMFDVTGVDNVGLGSEVVLFGSQNGQTLPLDELAAHSHTISYELMCQVGKRVPRVYIKNGVETGFQDLITGQHWKKLQP